MWYDNWNKVDINLVENSMCLLVFWTLEKSMKQYYSILQYLLVYKINKVQSIDSTIIRKFADTKDRNLLIIKIH